MTTQLRPSTTYAPQGAMWSLWDCRGYDEVVVAGSAGTGKSRAILEYLYMLCGLHPGIRVLIARATRASLTESALVTFERHVVPQGHAWVRNQIRRVRQSYELPNGSEIVVGGLDNTARIMSTEFDCVVGETLVTSSSEVQRSYRRPYSGQLITVITALGNELTGTPNHPIFTDQGWVALGLLREGDYVISRDLVQDVRAGGNPDVQHQPATIAEVARTLALTQASRAERVETVGMDFHGDGTDGYVDVISTAGSLHDRVGASIFQPIVEDERRWRDFESQPLMRLGSLKERPVAVGASEVSRRRIEAVLTEPLLVLGRRIPSLSRDSAGSSEPLSPVGVGVPDVPHGLPLAFGSHTQTSARHTLLEAFAPHVGRLSSFEQPDFPFHVAPDRIVKIAVGEARYGQHVYNLQTENNWYVANGIISHNCIYVQECREIEESSWEDLTSRLRNNRLPWQQIIGDTNPDGPTHWIKLREQAGRLKVIESRHEDNPVLYDERRGEYTEAGRVYIGRLDNLTGVRHKRLRLGLWVGAEGLVYDLWDPALHEIEPFEIPDEWPRFRAVDFGYSHAFACLWGTTDEDGRLYIYRQLGGIQKLTKDWAHRIRDLSGSETYAATVTDHALSERSDLEAHLGHGADECQVGHGGYVGTTPAIKDVGLGIQTVANRMKRAGDGDPRLFVFKNSQVDRDPLMVEAKQPTCLQEEMPRYVWAQARSQQAGLVTLEEPVKLNDHWLDAARYMVMHLDDPRSQALRMMGGNVKVQTYHSATKAPGKHKKLMRTGR